MEHHSENENVSIAVDDVSGQTKETVDTEMLDIDSVVNDSGQTRETADTEMLDNDFVVNNSENEKGDFHDITENTPNNQENCTSKNRDENIGTQSSGLSNNQENITSEYKGDISIATESSDLVNDQENLASEDQSENLFEAESVLGNTASVDEAEFTEKSVDDEISEVATVEKTIPELKPPYVPRLPLSRIKNIMKLDPDPECSIFSQDSVYLITKAAELFIAYLSREAARSLTGIKRKTLMKKDVDSAIDAIPQLSFLDGVFE